VSPEVAAARAILRAWVRGAREAEGGACELDKLEPPEPAASIAEAEVGIVLGALHLAAVPTTRPPDEAPEQRDEGVALWERVLAIVDPKDLGASFELAWSALVDAADKYLDRYGPEVRRPRTRSILSVSAGAGGPRAPGTTAPGCPHDANGRTARVRRWELASGPPAWSGNKGRHRGGRVLPAVPAPDRNERA